MEPWRTMVAHDGGVEAQNEALEGLKTRVSYPDPDSIGLVDPDPGGQNDPQK